jgi:hypothetical protein
VFNRDKEVVGVFVRFLRRFNELATKQTFTGALQPGIKMQLKLRYLNLASS